MDGGYVPFGEAEEGSGEGGEEEEEEEDDDDDDDDEDGFGGEDLARSNTLVACVAPAAPRATKRSAADSLTPAALPHSRPPALGGHPSAVLLQPSEPSLPSTEPIGTQQLRPRPCPAVLVVEVPAGRLGALEFLAREGRAAPLI